jgi:hypothetical protein
MKRKAYLNAIHFFCILLLMGNRAIVAEVCVREVPLGPSIDNFKTFISPDRLHLGFIRGSNDGWQVTIDGKKSELYKDIPGDIIFSSDGTRSAYVAKDGNEQTLFVDQLKAYQDTEIFDPKFSTNGKRLMYCVRNREGKFLVVDQQRYAEGVKGSFSPDSKHVAVFVQKDGKHSVLMDGVAGQEYDNIPFGQFTEDSKHFFYVAEHGGRQFVVIDGKRAGDAYVAINHDTVRINKNGKIAGLVVYWRNSGQCCAIVDGKEGATCELINYFDCNPEDKTCHYVARKEGRWYVVVGNDTFGPYTNTQAPELIFSPNQQRYAAAVERNGKWFVLNDGREFGPYGPVSDVGFSIQRSHLVYVEHKSDPYMQRLIFNGKEDPEFFGVKNIGFSPDEKHYLYDAAQKDAAVLVVDGQVRERADDLTSQLIYSGGKYYVNIVKADAELPKNPFEAKAPQKVLVVDHKLGKPYQVIGNVIFSQNQKHFAYGALQAGDPPNHFRIVVDGIECEHTYEDPIPESKIVFTSDRNVSIILARDGQFVRLEIETK